MSFHCLRIAIVVIAIFIAGCSHLDNKRYLVSIYQLENATENAEEYFKATKLLLTKNGGVYLKSPIIVEKDLPNAAQPSFTQAAIGNVIFIAEFGDRKSLDNYVNDPDVIKQMFAIEDIAGDEIIFVAKDFNPMGMMVDSAALNTFKPREKPAFLMINDISMNSLLNPMTSYRVMSYMNSNFPMLEQADVGFIRPLEKIENIRGYYDFDVLGLSEWPSEKVFTDFHLNPVFKELAKDTRNKAFSAFTESKAHSISVED